MTEKFGSTGAGGRTDSDGSSSSNLPEVGRVERHHGQHGVGCPGCVVCPTCKQRVDDHDLDGILACSAFQEARKEARRGA